MNNDVTGRELVQVLVDRIEWLAVRCSELSAEVDRYDNIAFLTTEYGLMYYEAVYGSLAGATPAQCILAGKKVREDYDLRKANGLVRAPAEPRSWDYVLSHPKEFYDSLKQKGAPSCPEKKK